MTWASEPRMTALCSQPCAEQDGSKEEETRASLWKQVRQGHVM